MLFLSRSDAESLLSLPVMLDALESGFRAYSTGKTSVPPRMAARTEAGLLAAMPGWVEGAGLVVKAVSVFPRNVETGRPSHQALINVFDERDGTPMCVMDGGYITAMRTGGGSAVSARLLARPESKTLAILGAGVQGRSHLATVPLGLDFTEIRVASRQRAHAERLAALDSRCVVADSFEAAVHGADVVCCCTDAHTPVIEDAWLEPGVHLTSVGGTFGPELDAATIRRSRVFVEWRGAAEQPPPAGAHDLQGYDPQALTELGEVLAGLRPGRQTAQDITVYKSTGIAVEDAVVARMVYDAAVAAGTGVSIEMG